MLTTTKRKVIFLDRDGTIMIDKNYLNDPAQIEILPGVFTNLKKLRDCGYHFIIVTNQSGIARNIVEWHQMQAIHNRLREIFCAEGIDLLAFYYAPELIEFAPKKRKPAPGMILQAAHDYRVDLSLSWMIGDNIWDVEAGLRAECKSILLSPSETPLQQISHFELKQNYSRVSNWDQIAHAILKSV